MSHNIEIILSGATKEGFQTFPAGFGFASGLDTNNSQNRAALMSHKLDGNRVAYSYVRYDFRTFQGGRPGSNFGMWILLHKERLKNEAHTELKVFFEELLEVMADKLQLLGKENGGFYYNFDSFEQKGGVLSEFIEKAKAFFEEDFEKELQPLTPQAESSGISKVLFEEPFQAPKPVTADRVGTSPPSPYYNPPTTPEPSASSGESPLKPFPNKINKVLAATSIVLFVMLVIAVLSHPRIPIAIFSRGEYPQTAAHSDSITKTLTDVNTTTLTVQSIDSISISDSNLSGVATIKPPQKPESKKDGKLKENENSSRQTSVPASTIEEQNGLAASTSSNQKGATGTSSQPEKSEQPPVQDKGAGQNDLQENRNIGQQQIPKEGVDKSNTSKESNKSKLGPSEYATKLIRRVEIANYYKFYLNRDEFIKRVPSVKSHKDFIEKVRDEIKKDKFFSTFNMEADQWMNSFFIPKNHSDIGQIRKIISDALEKHKEQDIYLNPRKEKISKDLILYQVEKE